MLLIAGVLLVPRYGLVARRRRAARVSQRVRLEDALKHLYNCELGGDRATAQSLAGAAQLTADQALKLLIELERRGLAAVGQGGIQLTEAGRSSALHILRAHRLWERHLADETGYQELEWHGQAEQIEHQLSPQQVEALAARLGQPTHDPHGDPIPSAEGELVQHGGIPLNHAPTRVPLLIVHIEDEPPAAYAQLVAEGLHPGSQLQLIEATAERVRFWSDDDEHLLAPIVASNISVVELAQPPAESAPRLSDLKPGHTGQVLSIAPQCRGLERRRLLDLGVLPGTEITAELVSPGADPVAYRIREALIALRQEQAELILLEPPASRQEALGPPAGSQEVLEPEALVPKDPEPRSDQEPA